MDAERARRLSFAGKPAFGTSPTPAGVPVQIRVALQCLGCPVAAGPTSWGWNLASRCALRYAMAASKSSRNRSTPSSSSMTVCS